MRGHVQRVRRLRCDLVVAPRGLDAHRGQRREIIAVDQVVGDTRMVRVLFRLLIKDRCRLKLLGEQLDRAYAGAVTEEGKERTADSNWFFYQRLIEACVQTSRLREAFLRAEEGSSRSLRDELARVSLPAPGLPKPLVAEESALLERLRVIDLTLRATDDTDGRAQLINEFRTVQERISAIWQEMESHPEAAPYLQLRRGERLGWDQLQGWFSEQPQPSAFVEFLDLGTRWIALVVTTGDAEPRVVELDLPEPLLLELVTNYTTALSEGREVAGSAAAELANRLLVPLAAHLSDIPVVCFIPQGLLHHVPLHALAYQSGPLAESVVVHYAPSAAVAIRRKEGPWPGLRASNLVTVGNPTGDLPFADLEATSIARRFSCSPLIGDAASAPRVSAELARADAAHIAAHAWFDWGDPLASGILLAGNTVFNARDAMSQRLRLRLLVLSACSTGQQMVSVGNSLAGLARGFLYAGVQQLVLSLWPVNDMSTMLLMDEFYASLDQGLAVGEALRRAQSYLRNATNEVIVARLVAERRRPSAERILDDEQVSALWRRFVLQDPTLRPFEHPHHWAPFFVTGSL